jgi:hypothetical protein
MLPDISRWFWLVSTFSARPDQLIRSADRIKPKWNLTERELSQLAAWDQDRAGKIDFIVVKAGYALRIEDNPRSEKLANQDTTVSPTFLTALRAMIGLASNRRVGGSCNCPARISSGLTRRKHNLRTS